MNPKNLLICAFLVVVLVLGVVVYLSLQEPVPVQPVGPISTHVVTVNSAPTEADAGMDAGMHSITIEAMDEKGEPIGEAAIRIQDKKQETVAEGTIIDGNFQTALVAGSYSVSIDTNPDLFFPFEGMAVEIKGPSTIQIEINRKYKVHGFVFNTNHVPIPDSTVYLHSKWNPINCTTDKNGYFSAWPVKYLDYTLVVSHPDYDQWQKNIQPAADPILIVLGKGALLTVLTLDETGAPVGGTEVACQATLEPEGLYMKSQQSNRLGQAYFDEIQSGTYTFTAKPPFPAVVQPLSHWISAGEPQEVTLTIQRKTFTLTGTVMEYQTSKIIPSVTVVCRNEGQEIRCLSDQDGRFAFPGLPHGVYTLWADPVEGYFSGDSSPYTLCGATPPKNQSFYVDEDTRDIVLYLKKGWVVRGRVFDSERNPVPDAILTPQIGYKIPFSFWGSMDNPGEAISDQNGQFILIGYIENTSQYASLLIKASHAIYDSTKMSIPYPQTGAEIDGLEFVLGNRLNVRGIVKSNQGKPIKDAFVTAHLLDDSGIKNQKVAGADLSGQDGAYAMALNAKGTYICKVEATGYNPSEEKSITVKDKDISLNFQLEPDTETGVDGYVLNQNYQPVAGASIYSFEYDQERHPVIEKIVKDTDLGQFFMKTGTDGSFHVPSQVQNLNKFKKQAFRIAAIKEEEHYVYKSIVTGIEPGTKNVMMVMDSVGKEIAKLYGQVIYQGNPVTEYSLLVQKSDLRKSTDRDRAWTFIQSPDGRFSLDADVSDCPILLAVHHPIYGLAYSDPLYLSPDEVRQDIVLIFKETITLQGTILNKNTREPIAGAEIWTTQSTDVEQEQFFARGRIRGKAVTMTTQMFDVNQSVLSDQNGNFQIPVPKGKIWMHIWKGNFNPKSLFLDCTLAPSAYNVPSIELLPVGMR
jgi:hypothetical protein